MQAREDFSSNDILHNRIVSGDIDDNSVAKVFYTIMCNQSSYVTKYYITCLQSI